MGKSRTNTEFYLRGGGRENLDQKGIWVTRPHPSQQSKTEKGEKERNKKICKRELKRGKRIKGEKKDGGRREP